MSQIKIEHIAMYVADLEKAKLFFEKYFNAKSGEKYHNKATGFMSYFLEFSGEARLEIMPRAELSEKDKSTYPKGFHHIALSVGSKEVVDSITEQLRFDGYEIISNPRTTGDGYYESCIADSEGNLIEVTI